MSKTIIEQYLRDRENALKTTKPVVKLTQAMIDWLPVADKEYSVGEALVPSLSVRVRPTSGSKTFYVVRKVNGKTIRSRICNNHERPYSQGSDSVLAIAKRVVVDLQDGITPAKRRHDRKLTQLAEQKLSMTVEQACTNYIDAKSRQTNTTQGYKRFRDNHLDVWRNYKLHSITEDDAADLHDEITEEVGPVAANNVLRFFRSVWNYHKRKLGLGDSPTIIFTRAGDNIKDWNPENRRVRYVAKEELKAWWDATERLRTDYDGDGELAADYLQFAVLTGLRRREITNLEWGDINVRRKTFTIKDNKSKRSYSIPVTRELRRILDRRSTANKPFDFDDPKRFIRKVSEWSGVQFSSHDLRRTFLSHATAAGISLPIQKALVNHSRKGDVTEGYIQIDMDAIREASQDVQDFILLWVRC